MPPPPRRPTYGGPEERTPLPLTISDRMLLLEAHVDRAVAATGELTQRLDDMMEILTGPAGKPEDGVLHKVYLAHQRRRSVDKIIISLVAAAAIAMAAFLLRVSYIVQSARVP